MILVTGASGKTGQAVVAALSRAGAPTRALVHRPSQIETKTNLGAREALAADMRLPAEARRAAEGMHAVYHICPNVNPDEIEIGRSAIAAAKEAGVEHFVARADLIGRVCSPGRACVEYSSVASPGFVEPGGRWPAGAHYGTLRGGGRDSRGRWAAKRLQGE